MIAEDKDAIPEELDDRTRDKYLAIMQFLTEKELLETLVAFEKETGIKYMGMRVNGILNSSLDMFARYGDESGEKDPDDEAFPESGGISCTGQLTGDGATFKTNVTSVAWVVKRFDELTAVAATTDKRLQVLDADGSTLADFDKFSSPILGLDATLMMTSGGREVHELLACHMGGEVTVLSLRRPSDDEPWSFEVVQQFKDHLKHVSCGRFAPPSEESASPQHFVTGSRDSCANIYRRGSSGTWELTGTARMQGEITCCAWLGARSFAFAARDDNNLRYWDVDGGAKGEPCEKMKTNMNALGDEVVSFAVLAIAVSPDRQLVAVSTDKSRIIVLRAFTNKQLRNLYGAQTDAYDMPSVAFSLDQTYLYATSSLSAAGADKMCGQMAVFELKSGQPVLHFPCHTKPVRCLSLHPLSEVLVTGSFDKTVKYWN